MKQVITLTSLVLASALGLNLEAQVQQTTHTRAKSDAECQILLGNNYQSAAHRYVWNRDTCTCEFRFTIPGLNPCTTGATTGTVLNPIFQYDSSQPACITQA